MSEELIALRSELGKVHDELRDVKEELHELRDVKEQLNKEKRESLLMRKQIQAIKKRIGMEDDEDP